MFPRVGRCLTAVLVSPPRAAAASSTAPVNRSRWNRRQHAHTVSGSGRHAAYIARHGGQKLKTSYGSIRSSTSVASVRLPHEMNGSVDSTMSEHLDEGNLDAILNELASARQQHRPTTSLAPTSLPPAVPLPASEIVRYTLPTSKNGHETSRSASTHDPRLARLQRMLIDRRRAWHEKFRKSSGARRGGWLYLADILEQINTRPPPSTGRIVDIPTGTLAHYAGSAGPNNWIEHIGTGVHVCVLKQPETEATSSTSRVLLRGSGVQVKQVEQKLRGLADPYILDNDPKPTATSTSLDAIDSVRSFHRHVLRHTLRGRRTVHEKSIVKDVHRLNALRLVTMFADPRISKFASTASLKRALYYFGARPELRGAANRMYADGWRMGLVRDVGIMNLRLTFALKHNLGKMAKSTVQDMRRLDITPDDNTWSLLYYASPDLVEQRKLLHIMLRAEVTLSPQALSRIALCHIEHRFPDVRNDLTRWKTLVEEMDNFFGKNEWLTSTTLKHLLYRAKRLRMSIVFESLIELAWEHEPLHVLEAHVNCFHYFRSREDLARAVTFLKGIVDRQARLIQWEYVVPAIYMTAWDCKATNVCRVLWTFAAVHGLLTETMRITTIKYLYPDMPSVKHPNNTSDGRSRRANWRIICAHAVSGVDAEYFQQIRPDYPRLSSQFPQAESHVDFVPKWSSDEAIRAEQIALIKAIHFQDRQAWRKYREVPASFLVEALAEAQELDLEWQKSGKVDSMTAVEARRDTMTLPVELKSEDMLRADSERRQEILADAAYVGAELKVERPRSLRHLEQQEDSGAMPPDAVMSDDDLSEEENALVTGSTSDPPRADISF